MANAPEPTYSLPAADDLKPEIRPYKQELDDLLLCMDSSEAEAIATAPQMLEHNIGDPFPVIFRHLQRHLIRVNRRPVQPVSSSSSGKEDAAFSKAYHSYARPFQKGQVAAEWGGNQRAVLLNYGTNASSQAKLLAIRKNLYTNQTSDIMQKLDASNMVKSASSAEELITAVEELFQPDLTTLATTLQAARHDHTSETASDFCKILRKLYEDTWAPLPFGEKEIQVLVLKFHPPIARSLDAELRVCRRTTPGAIDFGALEAWAKQYDEKEITLAQGPHANTRSKTNQNKDPKTQANSYQASSSDRGRGGRGGRGGGRGGRGGRGGGTREEDSETDTPAFQKLNLGANCITVSPLVCSGACTPARTFARPCPPPLKRSSDALTAAFSPARVPSSSRTAAPLARRSSFVLSKDEVPSRPPPLVQDSGPSFTPSLVSPRIRSYRGNFYYECQRWSPPPPFQPLLFPYNRWKVVNPPSHLGGEGPKGLAAHPKGKGTKGLAGPSKDKGCGKGKMGSTCTGMGSSRHTSSNEDLRARAGIPSEVSACVIEANPLAQVHMLASLGPMIGGSTPEVTVSAAQRPPQGGNRRQRGAEPFLPQDRRPDQVPARTPYGGTAEDRMGAALITLTLAQLVQLASNPHFPELISSMQAFMHTSPPEPAISLVQEAFQKVAATFPMAPVGGGLGGIGGPSASTILSGNVEIGSSVSGGSSRPTASSGNAGAGAKVGSVDPPSEGGPSLHSPSVTHSLPNDETQGTYLNAAMVKPKVVYQSTASMPTIQAAFYNPDSKVQVSDVTLSLDTGCNVCIMSEKALARDWDSITKYGVVHNLKPFSVQLADESVSNTHKGVQGVKFVIGQAIYDIDFLVAPSLAHDYILGFGFQATFNLQIKPHEGRVTLGAEKANWVGAKNYTPYHSVSFSYAGKRIPFLLESHR